MTFLLPVVVALALNFVGSIDLSSLGDFNSVWLLVMSRWQQKAGWNNKALLQSIRQGMN